MRSLILGAALAAASFTAALADDNMSSMPMPPPPGTTSTTITTTTTTTTTGDPLAVLYGNTLIATAKGYEVHTYYAADHTFKGMVPAVNYPIQGTWELNAEGKVCRTFTPEPPGVTNPDCDPAPMGVHAVGEVWKDAEGNNVSIVAGVQ
jgi:hypothetical protein